MRAAAAWRIVFCWRLRMQRVPRVALFLLMLSVPVSADADNGAVAKKAIMNDPAATDVREARLATAKAIGR